MSVVDFGFMAIVRIDDKLPGVDDAVSTGTEELIGQSGVNSKLSKLVFGVGGGYRLSSIWSVGISTIIMVRSQNITKASYTMFFLNQPGNPPVSLSFVRGADYYNIRYAARIGLNYLDRNFWQA